MNSTKKHHYRSLEEAFLKSCGLQREEQIIAVRKYNTNVRIQVTGEGKPVLFIPGGPSAGTVWAPLAALLPNYRCILIDRPGSGLSAAINYQNLTSQRLTDFITTVVDRILDDLKIDKAAIVGSSFGGYWTLKYVLQQPERVTKLIIEGCPALIEQMNMPSFFKRMTYPLMKWLIPMLPTTISFSKKIMKDMGHTYAMDHHLISEAYFDWYASLCNHTITLKNDLIAINKIMAGGKVDPQYFLTEDEVAKIATPTLWLWGKNDPFGRYDIGNRLSLNMKNSTIYFFENSGHLPWMDDPNTHSCIIKDFLSKEN